MTIDGIGSEQSVIVMTSIRGNIRQGLQHNLNDDRWTFLLLLLHLLFPLPDMQLLKYGRLGGCGDHIVLVRQYTVALILVSVSPPPSPILQVLLVH